MVQQITTQYHAFDTSENQNKRLSGVVPAGVYSGFRVRPNGGSANTLDIITGNDTSSVLVTSEGVRVEETGDLYGVVSVQAADISLSRMDLVVAEYQFVANSNIQQTYKVIRGANQPDPTKDPVAPTVENAFQIPLAYVTVRPKSAFSGVSSAQILVTDVVQVANASFTAQDASANLKPEISPLDATRVYVFPGIFLSLDSTGVIDFEGGYSEPISILGYADNEVRYTRFGLTDAGAVVTAGDAASEEALPDLTRDVFPLAVARTRRTGNSVFIEEITDIRFPHARRQAKLNEEANYKSLLSESVFEAMFVDTLVDSAKIDLTTVKLFDGSENEFLSAAMESKDTSLTVSYTGDASVPPQDVTISTTDILLGGNSGVVYHFMIVAETVFSGLRFRYSTSSSTGGFTTQTFAINQMVSVPAGTNKLFIQFVFPRSAFLATKSAKIFSYAALLNIDSSVLNASTIGELGIDGLKNNLNNLIANGSFYYWSRYTSDGGVTDYETADDQTYLVSDTTDEFVLADGWQITSNLTVSPVDGSLVTRTVLGTLDNESVTGMKLTAANINTDGDAVGGGGVVAEYRLPAAFELKGRRVTFALDYLAGAAGDFEIGVAFYQKINGALVLLGSSSILNPSAQGTLTISSSDPVPATATEIGFYIRYNSTSAVTVYRARAVSGEFNAVPYTPVINAPSVLRQYYERGRVFFAAAADAGNVVGTSTQFGTPKAGIGTVGARAIVTGGANRSVNVSDISVSPDRQSTVFSASAAGSGNVIIDLDWEAYVRFDGGLV